MIFAAPPRTAWPFATAPDLFQWAAAAETLSPRPGAFSVPGQGGVFLADLTASTFSAPQFPEALPPPPSDPMTLPSLPLQVENTAGLPQPPGLPLDKLIPVPPAPNLLTLDPVTLLPPDRLPPTPPAPDPLMPKLPLPDGPTLSERELLTLFPPVTPPVPPEPLTDPFALLDTLLLAYPLPDVLPPPPPPHPLAWQML